MKISFLIPFLSLFFVATVTAQNNGDLDLNFANNGTNIMDVSNLDVFQDVVVQDDQKIVAVGMSWNASYVATAYVVRFDTDGTLDQNFATNGIYTFSLNFEAILYSCVIGPDGSITVAGSTTDYDVYEFLIIRLDANGVPDPNFGNNGIVVSHVSPAVGYFEDMAMDVALDANGNILICGNSYDEDYISRPVVVRYKSTGDLDTEFGTDGFATIPSGEGSSSFDCMIVQPDGKIVAAGSFGTGLLYWQLLMVRFNEDGTIDNQFGNNGIVLYSYNNVDDEAFDIDLTSEGKIVLAGFTATQSYNFSALLLQYTAGGILDTEFGSGGVVVEDLDQYDVGEGVSVMPDGKIVMAGTSGEGPPNSFDMAVWKYNADGTADMEFGDNGLALHTIPGYYVMLHEVDFQDDGKIVAAGQARTPMNQNQFIVARLENEIEISVVYNATINVVDVNTLLPIENATVTLDGNTISTDVNGDAVFTSLSDGTFNYSVSFPCYTQVNGTITIEGADVSLAVELVPSTTNNVFFFVGDPLAIIGSTITLYDDSIYYYSFVTTSLWGGEYIADVPFGEYTYSISTPCHEYISGTITVDCNNGEGIAIFTDPAEYAFNNVFFFVGDPLAILGATVTLTDGGDYNNSFVTSDPWGGEMMADVPFGEYTYTISLPCFVTVTGSITVDCNGGDGIGVYADPMEMTSNNVFFFVGDPLAILGATITLTDGADFDTSFVTTDTFGGEMIGDVPFGDYTYTISTPCYETVSGVVVVDCNNNDGIAVYEDPAEIVIDNSVSNANNVLTAEASNYDYQWVDCNDNNSPIEGETDQSFSPTESGNYAVIISEENCSVMSECFEVIIDGVAHLSTQNGIVLYPNPCTDVVGINTSSLKGNIIVKMYSATGSQVLQHTYIPSESVMFDVSQLPAGAYIVSITDDKQHFVVPVVKQ